MKIKATLLKGKDLEPGDLFSTMGQAYWDGVSISADNSIGERVYIRTNTPSELAIDKEMAIYKIEIIKENDESSKGS